MRGTSPEATKQKLIADLIDARSRVLQAASALPSDCLDVKFLGVWSVHDLIAHLIGWDHINRDAVTSIRSGCLPAFYSSYDAHWSTLNAQLVQRYKQATILDTVACVTLSHRTLVDTLEGLSAEDLTHDFGVRSPGGRRVTIVMLLQAEAGDERKHAEQICAFAARISSA